MAKSETNQSTQSSSHSTSLFSRLVERGLAEFRKYADPAHQVEVVISPITHPVQRLAAIFIGTVCVVIGIPLAAALPVVPISPFAAVGLFCFARVSDRFRAWITRQSVFKIAMTVIYTRHEWPFRLLRWMVDRLAGGHLVYRETHPNSPETAPPSTAAGGNLSLVSPTARAGKV